MHELEELTNAMAFIENKENYYACFKHVIKTCTVAEVVASALWNAGVITDAEKLGYSSRINYARETAIGRHRNWVIRRLEHSQSQHTIESLVSTIYNDIFY